MPLTFTDNRVVSGQELSRLAAAIAGTYVVPTASGGAVTASSAMTVAVAAITATTGLYVNGTQDTTGYAGGTTVIATADVTNPRRDIVWYDGAGAIGSTAGTAAVNPVLPDLTAGRIALAEIYVTAGLTTIAAGNIIDRRANALPITVTKKIATATQTVSASTAFVDVVTSGSSTAKFTMAANDVWLCDVCVPLTFTGTGGGKFQWTGPAAPTAVYGQAWYTANRTQANDGGSNVEQPVSVYMQSGTTISAFSSALLSKSIAGGDGDIQSTAAQEIRLRLWVRNGANAGDVTLQIAQNSANGTTVIGATGFLMYAERMS